jgi:glycosyltransferase involved in cell wall biosynthesis
MTKVLMVGPYRQQNDGWGEAARTYALGMLRAGITLTLRPYYYTNDLIPKGQLHPMLEMAEENKYADYDAIIQMVLPPDLVYYSPNGEKNIAICFIESKGLLDSPLNNWRQNLEMMDLVMLSSNFEANQFPSDIKTSVIGQAIDLDWSAQEYPKLKQIEDRFNFYFIGSLAERKNLPILLAAFHLEFTTSENVGLLLKSGEPDKVKEICDHVRKQLGIRALYHQEAIMDDNLDLNTLGSVHATGDCFIMPSAGECLCRPVLDALAFGNQAIVTKGTAMQEICCANDKIHLIDSREECITLSNPAVQGIHSAYESWMIPSITDLRHQMRKAYEARNINKEKCDMSQYGLQQVGEKIKNEIDAQLA